ncbi:hypothetical protein GCM10009117_03760 [Gangjinia marincola]|uniref:Glycosyltransferase n=1 Tax=Gangjinia marincola TaxID=578463 RepID=A0ABN1MDN2_9FLAO
MKSIILIIPYFGKWPVWFDAYLTSISYNQTIHWLCPTDCEIPDDYPKNITFLKTDLKELNFHINQTVETKVPLTPRKFCDLKPAYGDIFGEHIDGYDFWGFCDMDVIWGDIRSYMTDDLLGRYDIISSRKGAISGHFNLFRNSVDINTLYKLVDHYKDLFEKKKFMWFDEQILTQFIQKKILDEDFKYKVYWEKPLLNHINGTGAQEYVLDRWLFDQGKLYQVDLQPKKEHMYLHFINWKQTMTKCEVNYKENQAEFYISYNAIHLNAHKKEVKFINNIRNIFGGYHAKLRKNRYKKRLKNILKKLN